MTMRQMLSAMVIAALFTAACGKSEATEAGREGRRGSQEGRRGDGPGGREAGTAAAAQGTTDMAKAMQGMAAAMGGKTADGKPIEPVAFQTLQTALAGGVGLEDGQAARRAHDDADAVLEDGSDVSQRRAARRPLDHRHGDGARC